MSNAGRHPRVCCKEAVHLSSRRQTLAKSAIFLPLTSNSSLRHRNDPMNAAQGICTEAVKRTVSRASQLGLGLLMLLTGSPPRANRSAGVFICRRETDAMMHGDLLAPNSSTLVDRQGFRATLCRSASCFVTSFRILQTSGAHRHLAAIYNTQPHPCLLHPCFLPALSFADSSLHHYPY